MTWRNWFLVLEVLMILLLHFSVGELLGLTTAADLADPEQLDLDQSKKQQIREMLEELVNYSTDFYNVTPISVLCNLDEASLEDLISVLQKTQQEVFKTYATAPDIGSFKDLPVFKGTIKSVKARQILDSRGIPTVEVDVICLNSVLARASAPSGASPGVLEALELTDGESDYFRNGVSNAVNNVNSSIGPALIGKDPTDQTGIDHMVHKLDGEQKLDANAVLAVSLAVCKAGAAVTNLPLYRHIAKLAGNKRLELPVPVFSVINILPDFMMLPVGAPGFKESLKMASEVLLHLKAVIKDTTSKEGLKLLKTAIKKAGHTGDVLRALIHSVTLSLRQISVAASFPPESGETEDAFIADLAVGLSAVRIKTGSPFRSEHNQLLRIEEQLGSEAIYAGAVVEKSLGGFSSRESI
ncbi:enolase-like [Lycium ferocissimum]|uniref:enolase-like n=1 Tax=Lycium ferocissimum TaxID=112874 RepID=UPI00281630A6|nr:enolase-like [Lycium ferocissimum]